MRPSRKRFQEALSVLKAGCKNSDLPWKLRIHCAECIMALYSVEVPGGTTGSKLVRDLVDERAFRRDVRAAVRQAVGKQTGLVVQDMHDEQDEQEHKEREQRERTEQALRHLRGESDGN